MKKNVESVEDIETIDDIDLDKIDQEGAEDDADVPGDYASMDFADYLNLVDEIMDQEYGITSDDLGIEIVKACHEAGQSPNECVTEMAENYRLDNDEG